MKMSAFGITTDLPAGWEGRITRRTTPTPALARAGRGTPGEVPEPVVHLANFPLPEHRGDFGSGAVDIMGADHLLLCLFEYGPESVGQPLFKTVGIPHLTPSMFSPNGLQRTIRGQAGCQRFFTVADRAFCLYSVLGAHRRATALVPLANDVLARTRIGRR